MKGSTVLPLLKVAGTSFHIQEDIINMHRRPAQMYSSHKKLCFNDGMNIFDNGTSCYACEHCNIRSPDKGADTYGQGRL